MKRFLPKPNFLTLALTVACLFLVSGVWGQTQTRTFSQRGTSTFIVPPGVTSITVEAWGGGGAGGTANANGSNNIANGGGGGGGAYAAKTFSVASGATYTVIVADTTQAPTANQKNTIERAYNGKSSIFRTAAGTVEVQAMGGVGGIGAFGNGSNGAGGVGSVSGGTGTKYSGGSGANGGSTFSGGGGGGAGSTGVGKNANNFTAGGSTSQNGGAGGAGINVGVSTPGNAGSTYGGGGGGARNVGTSSSSQGGTGAQGLVRISWNCPGVDVSNFNTSVTYNCSGNTATVRLSSTTLTPGTYTVNYSLSGANTTSTAQNVPVTFSNATTRVGTFTISELTQSENATTLTINLVSCGYPDPNDNGSNRAVFTTNSTTATVATTSWTGAVSTDWSTAGNWSCGLPSLTRDAIIPLSSRYPVIASGSTIDIHNLILNTSGSIASLTVAGTVQFTGNITRNGGAIDASAGTVSFNGAAAQDVPAGTFTGNISNLIINNATGVTLNSSRTVTGKLTLTSGALIMASGTLTVADGGMVERKEGSFTGTLHYGTGTGVDVSYTGSTDVATTPLLVPINVGGKVRNLTINLTDGTKTVTTTAGDINISGNVAINSGTLSIGNQLNVGGNWTRTSPGMFNSNNGIVQFNGTGAQTISVTGGGVSNFYNLIVNKTAGTLTLANGTDVNVSGILTLTQGALATGSNKVIIPQNASVSRGAGWVAGNLQKYIGATGDVLFEIGGPTNYRPVTVNFSSITTAGDLTAFVSQSAVDHPQVATSGIDASQSVNRYYSLTPSGLAVDGSYTVTFNYLPADLDAGADPAKFVVRRYNGIAWSTPTVPDGTATTSAIQAIVGSGGLSAINEFAIGECITPNVTDFTVASATTSCEINNARITINSTSLANGTYTVTYSLSGANTEESADVTMDFNNGTGIFDTRQLANNGTTIVTVLSIQVANVPACPSTLSSGGDYSEEFTFTANSWTGTNGSGWNTASNWSCNVVPTSAVDVIIPVVSAPAVYPVVASSDNGNFVRNLTILSGATVTVQDTLRISGELINNGTFDATAGTLELNGSTEQTLPGFTNTVQNLIVSNDVTLGGPLRLTGTLSFGNVNNTTLNSNGFLTLESTADTTARVADITNNLTNGGNVIEGDVTAERYVPSKTARKWTYVAVPVTGNTVSEAWQNDVFITGPGGGGAVCGLPNNNGFDVTIAKAPSMFTYSPTLVNGSRWEPIPNTSIPLVPGTGYRINIRGPRGADDANCQEQLNTQTPPAPTPVVLDATGTLAQYQVPVTLNNPNTHLYTLIGNPYASEISFPQFRSANASTIANKYWTYTPFNSFNTYASFNAGTGTNFPAGVNPNIIASGQAFFVEAASTGVTPQVIFREQHKTSGQSANSMFRVMNWVEKLRVKYTDAGDTQLDEIVVRYGDDAEITTAVNKYDAVSFNSGTYIASRKGVGRFAIQTRPLGFKTDTVALTITATENGTYKLRFSEYENFVSAPVIELLDAYTGTATDVKAQNSYSFSIDANAASQGDNRFKLVFKSGTALPIRSINLTAERKQQNVQLNWTVAGEQNVSRYEVERSADGQSFQSIGKVSATANNNSTVSYAFTDQQPLEGAAHYRIQVQERSGEVRYSAIVKLKEGNNVTVQLYPNPVKNKLNVVVSGAGSNRYDLQVLNMHGAEVMRRNSVLPQNNVVTLDTKTLSAGMYTIRLTNATGEIITEIFVKQ